jgi:DNA-binding beta-propeller fold protein YncE
MLRRNMIFNKPGFFLKTSIIFSVLLLLSVSSMAVRPAHGIRYTKVKHLFDINYNFKEPSDISVSKDGLIYVVDGVNNSIKVFSREGKFLFSFGKKGISNGEFKFPLGIDIDNSGRVYIADSGNHRVQIFDARGNFISRIAVPAKDGNLSDPVDVAVDDSHQKLYVSDNNNHYILAYDLSDFRLLQTFGSPGFQEREFRYPFLMTLDRNNYLYIVDVINTRVQVFNPSGLFVTIIGGWGVEKGNFFRPKGVAIDQNNRVYVSDSYMGVIQVFKNNGEFYSAVGDPVKKAVKKFSTPVGIFIDNSNRLYVVEMFAERVSVYSLEEEQ